MEERIRRLRVRLLGWVGYFALADTTSVFRELDEWLRRRLEIIAAPHDERHEEMMEWLGAASAPSTSISRPSTGS